MIKQNIFYRRHLPHYQPSDATFHVVFRLEGSLPLEVITDLKLERERLKTHISDIDNDKQKHEEWRT
jgi:hypothetical protein